MSEEKLTPLEGSIQKWEGVLDGSGLEQGAANCPLCVKHLRSAGGCTECVIGQHTSRTSCYATPYEAWDNHQQNVHDQWINRSIQCPTCREIAQEELDFLKSLRK